MVKSLIFIVFILARGPDSLNRNQMVNVVSNVRRLYRTVGIKIIPVRYIVARRDPTAFLDSALYGALERRRFWEFYLRKHYLKDSRAHRHVVLPPVHFNKELWYYGAATVCSYRNYNPSVGISSATISDTAPSTTAIKSMIPIAHEIGHAIGASHDDTNHNIMNSGAGQFWAEPLGFNENALREFEECL
jgi:hypothetical protein